MDPKRFDTLVQSLATPGSRRRLLGGLLAGSLAPLGATAQVKRHADGGPQPAKCRPIGKRCSLPASADARHGHGKGGKGKHHPPSCDKCCSRFGSAGPDGKARCTCKGEGIDCANDAECCAGQCRNGSCTGCPANTVFCADGCADLQTNNQHCGSCDIACAVGQRCVDGSCVCDATSCPTGCCDGTNCKRGTSAAACGTSGTGCQTCDAGQRCDGTSCVCDATSCPDGCCDGTTCVPFAQQTTQRCGTAGAACAICDVASETCRDGACVCPSGVICSVSGCCASANDVCDQNEQCCTPTCTAEVCGGDGCGGTCDCPSGQTCLSNGSCATACPSFGATCGTTCARGNCQPDTQGALYCLDANGAYAQVCANNSECNHGYYCYNTGVCWPLCN